MQRGMMGKLIDLKKQRFGFWLVIDKGSKTANGKTRWLCQCECGKQKLITTNSLRTGNSTSCGCNHVPDLSNEVFEDLTVIKLDKTKSKGRRYWLCKCKCNNIVSVSTYKLRNSLQKSCGECQVSSLNSNINKTVKLLHHNIEIIKDKIDYIFNNFKPDTSCPP